MEPNEFSRPAELPSRSSWAALTDNLSTWKSKKMTAENGSTWKTWIPVMAFVGQGLTTVIYFTQSMERTTAAVDGLKSQVTDLKNSNQLVAQMVTDVAILKVKIAITESQVSELRSPAAIYSGSRPHGFK